jgi:hypothetical protein
MMTHNIEMLEQLTNRIFNNVVKQEFDNDTDRLGYIDEEWYIDQDPINGLDHEHAAWFIKAVMNDLYLDNLDITFQEIINNHINIEEITIYQYMDLEQYILNNKHHIKIYNYERSLPINNCLEIMIGPYEIKTIIFALYIFIITNSEKLINKYNK